MKKNSNQPSTAELTIDPEFKNVLPRLSEAERVALEESIQNEGCLAPLLIWEHKEKKYIIDGFNRYEICKSKGIPYTIKVVPLTDHDAVKMWIFLNQNGRRNMTTFSRIEAALKFKNIFKKQAKANQRTAGGDKRSKDKGSLLANLPKAISVRQQIAELARSSERTVSKVELIIAQADDSTIRQLREGELSIDAVYRNLKPAEPSVNQGDSPPPSATTKPTAPASNRSPKPAKPDDLGFTVEQEEPLPEPPLATSLTNADKLDVVVSLPSATETSFSNTRVGEPFEFISSHDSLVITNKTYAEKFGEWVEHFPIDDDRRLTLFPELIKKLLNGFRKQEYRIELKKWLAEWVAPCPD